MQAIQTKYIGPTNFRGSRVKASCAAGSITLGWLSELDTDGNHRHAAETLWKQLGWNKKNKLLGGGLKDGSQVWVQVTK